MPKIKIFSTTTCPYCRMEKEYLTKNGVAFENVFVDNDPQAATYIVEKSGQMGVPVTELTFEDGRIEYILGFDRLRLKEKLGLVE